MATFRTTATGTSTPATFGVREPQGLAPEDETMSLRGEAGRNEEPAPTPAPAAVTVEGVAKTPHAQSVYIVSGYLLVLLAVGIAALVVGDLPTDASKAVKGVNAFAGLYVAAQAIERLLEPLRDWLGDPLKQVESPSEDSAKGRHQHETPTKKGATRSELVYVRGLAIREANTRATDLAAAPDRSKAHAAQTAAETAAAAQAAVEQERSNAVVISWAVASALGIVVSAWLGFTLLHSVGVQHAPVLLDVVVTGLAVGGGTKPLHDLIGNLEAAKRRKSDPEEVKDSAGGP